MNSDTIIPHFANAIAQLIAGCTKVRDYILGTLASILYCYLKITKKLIIKIAIIIIQYKECNI